MRARLAATYSYPTVDTAPAETPGHQLQGRHGMQNAAVDLAVGARTQLMLSPSLIPSSSCCHEHYVIYPSTYHVALVTHLTTMHPQERDMTLIRSRFVPVMSAAPPAAAVAPAAAAQEEEAAAACRPLPPPLPACSLPVSEVRRERHVLASRMRRECSGVISTFRTQRVNEGFDIQHKFLLALRYMRVCQRTSTWCPRIRSMVGHSELTLHSPPGFCLSAPADAGRLGLRARPAVSAVATSSAALLRVRRPEPRPHRQLPLPRGAATAHSQTLGSHSPSTYSVTHSLIRH